MLVVSVNFKTTYKISFSTAAMRLIQEVYKAAFEQNDEPVTCGWRATMSASKRASATSARYRRCCTYPLEREQLHGGV